MDKSCFKKQGHSSIQVEKSSKPRACFANKWAGLLSCLLTWEKDTFLNSLHSASIPYIRLETVDGAFEDRQ